jgi:hypothetical protein
MIISNKRKKIILILIIIYIYKLTPSFVVADTIKDLASLKCLSISPPSGETIRCLCSIEKY